MMTIMSSELGDLLQVIAAAMQDGDLVGHVQAWLDLATGKRNASERYSIVGVVTSQPLSVDGRRVLAVELASKAGRVTSRELASQAAVSSEAARGTLAELAGEGLLRKIGDRRGTHYVMARGNGDGT